MMYIDDKTLNARIRWARMLVAASTDKVAADAGLFDALLETWTEFQLLEMELADSGQAELAARVSVKLDVKVQQVQSMRAGSSLHEQSQRLPAGDPVATATGLGAEALHFMWLEPAAIAASPDQLERLGGAWSQAVRLEPQLRRKDHWMMEFVDWAARTLFRAWDAAMAEAAT